MLKAIEIQGARLLNVPWPHLAFRVHGPKCLRPHGILRIANKFDFIGEKRESSVRFVFRGVLEFSLWIAFPAMPDVKGGTNDSHPRRGPPPHKTE
jgi:hypothetical protein